MPPTENDVTFAKQLGKNCSIEQLKSGHDLYVNKCGACHYLHPPAQYSEEKWLHELPEMSEKAKLSSQEKQLVTDYLLTMRCSAVAQKK